MAHKLMKFNVTVLGTHVTSCQRFWK